MKRSANWEKLKTEEGHSRLAGVHSILMALASWEVLGRGEAGGGDMLSLALCMCDTASFS